jgi:hypothetical protein
VERLEVGLDSGTAARVGARYCQRDVHQRKMEPDNRQNNNGGDPLPVIGVSVFRFSLPVSDARYQLFVPVRVPESRSPE